MRSTLSAMLLLVGCMGGSETDDSVELSPGAKTDGDTSVELLLTPAKPTAKAIVRCTEWFSCGIMVAAWTDDVTDKRSARVTIRRTTDNARFEFNAVSLACRNGLGPPVYHYMLPANSSFSQWCDTIVLPDVTWARAHSSDPREEFEVTLAYDQWEPGLRQLEWQLAARWQ